MYLLHRPLLLAVHLQLPQGGGGAASAGVLGATGHLPTSVFSAVSPRALSEGVLLEGQEASIHRVGMEEEFPTLATGWLALWPTGRCQVDFNNLGARG